MKLRTIILLVLGVVLLCCCGLSGVYADREEHDFTLFKANNAKDPFSLFFPFRVEGPCEIRVYVSVATADKNLSHPLQVRINKLNVKNGLKAYTNYKTGDKSFQVKYSVDSAELAQGKNYQIVLNNLSPFGGATGKILIDYYGKNGAEQGAHPVYPDLTIADLRLNDQNMLQVEIVNKGPGRLPSMYYKNNVPDLYIYRNSAGWGGAGLQIIDPRMQLREVNGKVVYTFTSFKVTGTQKIRAIIDYHNTLREENEKNNECRRELTGKSIPIVKLPEKKPRVQLPDYPDLSITDLRLNDQNMLQVEIVNNGPGRLSPMNYQQNVPDLYVYRNKAGWGGATLKIIDPRMVLREVGGKVVYTLTGLKVTGTEEIRAIIDYHNTLKEQKEDNNVCLRKLTGKKISIIKLHEKETDVKPAYPDLAIRNIYLTRENNLAVEVVNNGGPLSSEFWQKNIPSLYIYRNGKGWGGATLKLFDPNKKLAMPGGKAVYISLNLKVSGTETIKAFIDSQNTVRESNEQNNEMTKTLTARRH